MASGKGLGLGNGLAESGGSGRAAQRWPWSHPQGWGGGSASLSFPCLCSWAPPAGSRVRTRLSVQEMTPRGALGAGGISWVSGAWGCAEARLPGRPARGAPVPPWPRSRSPDSGVILTTRPGGQRSLCDYTWRTITVELLNMETRLPGSLKGGWKGRLLQRGNLVSLTHQCLI